MAERKTPTIHRYCGVVAAPGRHISLGSWTGPSGMGRMGLTPDEARVLAKALVWAADVAAQPDPDDGFVFPDELWTAPADRAETETETETEEQGH